MKLFFTDFLFLPKLHKVSSEEAIALINFLVLRPSLNFGEFLTKSFKGFLLQALESKDLLRNESLVGRFNNICCIRNGFFLFGLSESNASDETTKGCWNIKSTVWMSGGKRSGKHTVEQKYEFSGSRELPWDVVEWRTTRVSSGNTASSTKQHTKWKAKQSKEAKFMNNFAFASLSTANGLLKIQPRTIKRNVLKDASPR